MKATQIFTKGSILKILSIRINVYYGAKIVGEFNI